MTFWFLVCEKHRAFQESSANVVKSIELQIGLTTKLSPLDDPFMTLSFPQDTDTWNAISPLYKALKILIFEKKENSFQNFKVALKASLNSLKGVEVNKDISIVLRRPLLRLLRHMNIQMGRIYMYATVTILWIAAIWWTVCKGDTPNKPEPVMFTIHHRTIHEPLDFPPLWPPPPSVPIPFNPNYSSGKP
ncbi:hypothetical protein [Spirosoma sp. KUDC1026]|uniref:hypothetical protein n=1 Tax=Spirosoma sp. KUDC1026 TaxID=2745947 RepID=UPI00159BA7FC|nr:hypothetical protein [Spirosoma sp. KUDC1026]QKZ14335.1 hypothetical protein HU175_17550 [Spirosoma sp. KUDC1026]